MDRRLCMCLRFGSIKAGEGERSREGLSGFEAGRCVLPRRAWWVSIERFVTCPGALFCRPSQMFDIIGGVWGVEGLYGRIRLEGGEGGSIQLHVRDNT